VIKLAPVAVEKPWGRTELPEPFATTGGKRIGEIWFPAPDGVEMPLLVKYLFTSERLSIQVHPSDEEARARGVAAGKEECWYILDAEPGATLGIGTIEPLAAPDLREAARTGEIEKLMQWHTVEPGMLFHIPPGTVHAIGAGISLIEIQQNSDITYRLYDYGRPRELHLDDGVAVARPNPFSSALRQAVEPGRSEILLETDHFTLAQIAADDRSIGIDEGSSTMVVPIIGTTFIAGAPIAAGECAVTQRGNDILLQDRARALLAWTR
jgi:mannose-6-phosphate isomerase